MTHGMALLLAVSCLKKCYKTKISLFSTVGFVFADAHQQPSIVIENIDATDSFIYDPPFTDDRYPAAVAEVLQTHRMVVQDEYHYSDVEYDMYHYWDEAFWLVELGLAHRHVLEELITERATVTAATSQKPAIQYRNSIETLNSTRNEPLVRCFVRYLCTTNKWRPNKAK
jgi:hypothetical protein